MSYLQQAIDSIAEFGQRYEKFQEELILSQYSTKTITIYTSKLAELSLRFGCLPEQIEEREIKGYLRELLTVIPPVCKSRFEHTIAALRCYYKTMGFPILQMHLPRVRHRSQLPEVLSGDEVKKLLSGTKDLREKTILSMLYSCGLRVSELIDMQIKDVDSIRLSVHIRQGKGRKDRYVPLAEVELPVLRAYYKQYCPQVYLFNGCIKGSRMSYKEVSRILKNNCLSSGIKKQITTHNLRHSYATHLLEMGVSIYRIKELLGHKNLKTTMVYLHIAQVKEKDSFSPLDVLFKPNRP
jgi:site-specific recombinase XerD